MGLFGFNKNRVKVDSLTEIRQEAPSLANLITASVEKSADRSDEIYDLFGGKYSQQKCSVLAELERRGVIVDIRPDGTVGAGPNLESYRSKGM